MLPGDQILHLRIVAPDGLLANAQLQPNGVDLTLDALWSLAEAGALGRSEADRHLPERQPLDPDSLGWYALPQGGYVVRYAELVAMPTDCAGLAFPRSSLLRMGVHVPTAVWDAGYRGRGEGLLVVSNPFGVRLQHGTRVTQLVLFRLTGRTAGYRGRYQEDPSGQSAH
jgi:dUTP pyrophosphatase